MQFLEAVANKKGDQKLAKKLAKKSASLAKKNKELHVTPKDKNRKVHQQKIKRQLRNIKSLKSAYEKQSSTYRKQLMPSFIDQGQATRTNLFRLRIFRGTSRCAYTADGVNGSECNGRFLSSARIVRQ
jgi:hypothetical protein